MRYRNLRAVLVASSALVASSVLAVGCGGSSGTASKDGASAGSEGSAVPSAPASAPSMSSTPSIVGAASSTTAGTSSAPVAFVADVWADNWFSLTVNGVAVGEDSVPITTEKSFNAETIRFTATYPLTIAMVTKDYRADDSGLEYIGTSRQQMGDGGFIAQIREQSSGRLVAATGKAWRGLVVQRAPLDKSCEKAAKPIVTCRWEAVPEPPGWQLPGFDDAAWTAATVYTAAQVGTKDGYDTIRWGAGASLIWTADLEADNTILWRATAPRPA